MQRIYRYFDQKTLENVAKLSNKLYSWPIYIEYYFTGVTKFKRLRNVRYRDVVMTEAASVGIDATSNAKYRPRLRLHCTRRPDQAR